MAAVLEYYHGAVTWADYQAMSYADLRALEDRMISRRKSTDDT